MLDHLIHDFAEFDFWRRAVIGGVVISVVCSLLSVYVVLKRMAFIGQGISHSAFGGIALGVLLFAGAPGAELKIFATALAFCLVVALLIAMTTRHSSISEDSAIGIFFVASMALGVLFFKSARGFNQDVFSYLFGSISAITQNELWAITALGLVVCLPLLLLQKELLYYAFDEEMAGISGVPVGFLRYMLLALLSLTIVISARMVGIILISAFLILPGAIALLLARHFCRMVWLSLIFGVITTLAGIAVSWLTDWPTGAAIVVVQFCVFIVIFAFRKFQGVLSA
ncbi:MAG: metal ABC transporter permease [bacterium]|nr:metal ABC transporter permease [Candidatus Sumerlaeota bacterium]